ncbi:unnamed protein product [Lactuca virosa]|uniref:Large ribosomal subunit protein uL6 alpha-beta domain-containing protein n=1 Tax=Lactuca virosa TaxID=75947 RepID=A0AAU9LFN0_9ASTR|nr:unnamed protein product [Lactuca virosa]
MVSISSLAFSSNEDASINEYHHEDVENHSEFLKDYVEDSGNITLEEQKSAVKEDGGDEVLILGSDKRMDGMKGKIDLESKEDEKKTKIGDNFQFLKIVGVGFKARAESEGHLLFLKLGYSHEVELTVPPAVRVFFFKPNIVCCTGIDKEMVY